MQYADDTTVFLTFRIERSYKNCKIYCILQDQQQNLRYLFTGLQGKPLQSYENYKIDENEENVL